MKVIRMALTGTGFAWLMTTLGAAVVFFMGKTVKESVHKAFLGFAAGVMIAASVWSLLIPSIEQTVEGGGIGWLPAAGGFLIGVLFLLVMDRWNQTRLLMLAVTLHNIPEGMAMGLAFANAAMQGGGGTEYMAAFTLAIGIGIQNFPEGAAISLPLKKEGFSSVKAFWWGCLSGIVEPVFGVLTVLLAAFLAPYLPWLLSFAAGAMMYVAAQELIPEAHSDKNGKVSSYAGTLGVMAGFLLMMILDVALG